MALYQPSYMVPHNQAIDATNAEDMKFSWVLNGNNMLCAYNIQIFDVDSNELVYELVSTENQRIIQANIDRLAGYLNNQENKLTRIDENEDEYKVSNLKSEFKLKLESERNTLTSKYNSMAKTVEDVKNARQIDVSKYFENWGIIVETLRKSIGRLVTNSAGDVVVQDEKSAEAIKKKIEQWMDIDPERTDGIEYEDIGDVQLIDTTSFEKVKGLFNDYDSYYKDVLAARAQKPSTDTSFINDTTLEKARKTMYLLYSQSSYETYYARDLWNAVEDMWRQVNFDEKRNECQRIEDSYRKELQQQEFALAHLNGGKTKQDTNAYNSPSESSSNLAFIIPNNGEVAISRVDPQPPTGWSYVIYNGNFGYVKTSNIKFYDIADGKYYLDKPISPTNYEGKQNTIYHQLPINILENGKSYKWSVTLYWSTSGRYDQDNLIDGHLTSVECYFDTRKRPNVYLGNIKQVFTNPSNYVHVIQDCYLEYKDTNKKVQVMKLKKGDNVLFLHLDQNDEHLAHVKCTTEDNREIEGIVEIIYLSEIKDYDLSRLVLGSKYATFVGGYEQEQHVSVSYFRWVLSKLHYDTEEVDEIVEDTGMIPSIDIKFFYDGFLNGEKYSIKLYVQTLDNVEAESIEYKFKVSYIDYKIENMVNAENSPIEHGIIVEWSNLRLTQGRIVGGYHYEEDCPSEAHTALSLDKGAELTFDEDKGKPLALDWDANQVVSLRIDEDRPDNQDYYIASGLDDNGEVISKTLRLERRPDTDTTGKADLLYIIKTPAGTQIYSQEIIASPLYWYIVIMKSNELVIYQKFADGLFPMRELMPSYNEYTDSREVVPLPLRYYDEPVERVRYDYQTIVRKDGSYRD